jgi:hypothetical protein
MAQGDINGNGLVELTGGKSAQGVVLLDSATGAVTGGIPVTGPEPASAFRTTTPLTDGATYTSSIIDARSYSQLQTMVLASRNGTIRAEYYSDASGTDTIRTLSVPYVAANGYQIYSAPVFSAYVRYYFDNAAGAAQTDFFFETKLLYQPLSAQVSRIDAPIVSGMTAAIGRQVIVGQQDGGRYVNVPTDEHGHLEVSVHGPLTAFRDLRIAELTPTIQERFSYGILADAWSTFASSGTATATNGAAEVSSGAGANNFCLLQSKRRFIYRPGEGGLLRFTAAFPGTGEANHRRLVGIGSVESGWFIGEDPDNAGAFGFLHRYGGKREIRTLTVSAGASGAETATVTLNGVSKNVAVTSGTATFNASQIAAADYSATGNGWDADQVGATVIFISRTAEAFAGSFTLATSGGGTLAGTFATTRAGAASTDDWTAQTAWNGDVLDGTGGETNPSSFDLDHRKGNVYAINYQYLGYGPQMLYVETIPPSGNNPIYVLAHVNNYLNENDYPSMVNPCAPIVMESRSLGATSNKTVRSGSFGAFIEGKAPIRKSQPVVSASAAALANTEIPLFSIRLPQTFNGLTSQVIAEVHKIVVAFKPQTSNFTATFRLRRNATLTGGTAYARPYTYGAMLLDTAATGVSGGTVEWQATLTDSATLSLDFDDQNILLEPGDVLTATAVASSGTTNIAAVSLTYGELQ